jgi:hypothetical protein
MFRGKSSTLVPSIRTKYPGREDLPGENTKGQQRVFTRIIILLQFLSANVLMTERQGKESRGKPQYAEA